MSRRLAACWAVLWILLGGTSTAAADRRPVAVIDLAGDGASPATKLAEQLSPALLNHPELQPLANVTLAAELVGALSDPDGERLQRAWQARTTAEGQLAEFRFALAAQSVENAHDELLKVTPTAAAIQTYAELAFLLGQARLGERNAAAAATAFSIAHRLAPTFVPDPARYLPEVIAAYDSAKSRPTTTVQLTVAGHGRVWIDGREIGAAPVDADITTGVHVVWMTGVDRETRGRQVTVLSAQNQGIVIEDAPATDLVLVQRARARLKFAPDPTARAAAMKHLATLLGVGDAILLSVAKGNVIVQTWRDRAPGFSALREVRPTEPVATILKQLSPPPEAVAKPDDGEPPKPVPKPAPFYQQRRWQVAIVTGVVGLVVGSIAIYNSSLSDTVSAERPRWGFEVIAR